jgi:hypothetical protein
MKRIILKDFSGQINTDSRTPSTVDFRYSENFDLTRNDVLFPMKGQVAMTAGTNPYYYLRDFIYGNFGTGIGENVLAKGVQVGESAGGEPELYKISDTLPGTTWTTALTTTGTSVDDLLVESSNVFNNLFHLHKGFIYLATGVGPSSGAYLNKIGNVETSGQGATWTPRWQNITFNSITNAVSHRDNSAYFAYNNGTSSSSTSTVCKITDDSTVNTSAFSLPTGYTCTSVTPYGSYLAFAMKSNIKTNSYALIWDRDTGLAQVNETIDWGEGDLNILDNIDGHLIGISLVYNSSFNLNPKIVVKEWSGGTVNIVNTIYISTAFAPILSTKKWKKDNNLYFALKASINGAHNAIFKVCKNKRGQFVVVGDTSINNNVTVSTIDGFAKVGDIWYLAYDSSFVNRTETTSSYSAYGLWNSLINPSMPIADRPELKQLISIQCDYEAIQSGCSIVVNYVVDDGSSTTVISDSTVGSTSATMTLDSSGNQFTSGKDYEFIIASTGVVIKSLTYTYEILDTNI